MTIKARDPTRRWIKKKKLGKFRGKHIYSRSRVLQLQLEATEVRVRHGRGGTGIFDIFVAPLKSDRSRFIFC